MKSLFLGNLGRHTGVYQPAKPYMCEHSLVSIRNGSIVSFQILKSILLPNRTLEPVSDLINSIHTENKKRKKERKAEKKGRRTD